MSGYSNHYFEYNKEKIESESHAKECRRKLIHELSADGMIKIMFESYINQIEDYKVIKIAELYLK